MFHTQQLIESAASSECYLEPARTEAEMLIQRMYQFIWWNVDIEWEWQIVEYFRTCF